MPKIKKKNYKSLSRFEFELVEFVVDNDLKVFSSRQLRQGLAWNKNKCYRVTSNLRKKGLLESPLKGRYILDLPNYDISINQIASRIYWPSYISFWTALSYHGLTDQLPRTIYVVNRDSTSTIEFRQHKISFIEINSDYFFGYQDYDGFMADPEKAVIDSLHLPRYSGGIKEVAKAFDRDLDWEKLEEYANKINLSAVKKRLKYLMDRKGKENNLEVSGSYVKLDPSGGKGNRDKESLVVDNVLGDSQ